MQHLDIKTFIEKANKVHNNKYEYENIIWKNVGTKITINCKEHGDFKQTPSNHLMGKGCAYCSGVGRITPTIFLEKAIKIHNNKYKYNIDNTIKNNNTIEIICDTHGSFFQTPKNHLKGQGCPKCSLYYKYDKNGFIEKANKIHNNKYDYSLVDYKKNSIKINIICKIHGKFEQMPLNHLKGNGCYKCGGFTRNTKDFIEKAILIHNNIYDYSKVDYKDARTEVIIICKKHGEFEQIANYHLSGNGCGKCNLFGSSKISLKWLSKIENKLGYKIQHAGNTGEKTTKINGKLIRFDGYDEKTNTVYEFYIKI